MLNKSVKNPLLIFLTLGLIVFCQQQVHAQGTEFFSSPEKEKITPPKKDAKPKLKPAPKPKPKPVPKPKAVEVKPKVMQSISDVIFVLDTSGSMDAYLPDQKHSKLQAAQQALRFFSENMTEGTRFQLWSFNARLTKHPNSPDAKNTAGKVVFEPIGKKGSGVRQHLKKEVDGLETRGGTNLYHSIVQAIRYFRSSFYQVPKNTKRQKIIVVLADGQDDGLTPTKLEHVLSDGKRNPDVMIRTIGFGITQQDPLHRVLCQIASDPESCKIAKNAQNLQEIITSFSENQ